MVMKLYPHYKTKQNCFASTLLGVAVFCLFAMNAVVAQAAQLTRMAVVERGATTAVTFNLSDEFRYKLFTLDHPNRVVVDLKGVKKQVDLKQIKLDTTEIKRIRSGKRPGGTLRIVLDVDQPMLAESMIQQAPSPDLQQLVLELTPVAVALAPAPISPAAATAKPAAVKQTDRKQADIKQAKLAPKKATSAIVPKSPAKASNQLRDVVIAIDAGHGGKDPGAIGANGTQEKHIVLSIAKRLAAMINEKRGYTAKLIRSDDRYIKLAERRRLARDVFKADLFVSIHADSWKRRSARGASVFALSRRGANSALAKHLAYHESKFKNYGEKPSKSDRVLRTVLADLAMEGSMEHSEQVGGYILSELGRVAKLHKKKVEPAAFVVLKSPDVPSILVETGFISNPKEEKLLGTKNYQVKLSKAIVKGVTTYFERQPPPNTWLASVASQDGRHRITKGDTLSGIAQRYRISAQRLKQYNRLRDDVIHIGQVLHIPNS